MVTLQLKELTQCERDSDIIEALDSLPQGLPESLEAILDRIPPLYKSLVRQALAWILYCRARLRLEHLALASCIPTQLESEFTKSQRFREKHQLRRIFPTLIYVHPDTQFVELFHYAVRQYLTNPTMSDGQTSNKHYISPEEGNEIVMKSCFTYLRSSMFTQPLLSPLQIQTRQREFKRKLSDRLVLYMIFGWTNHAKEIKRDEIVSPSVYNLLSSTRLASWSELWELEKLRDYPWWQDTEEDIEQREWPDELLCELGSSSPSRSAPGSALYYAAHLGFGNVVRRLLQTESPNTFGGRLSSPLMAALVNKHLEIAKILLDSGANVDFKDKDGNTALLRAVDQNDCLGAELLLRYRADLTKRNGKGDTALHLAIRKMAVGMISEELFGLLLQKPDVTNHTGQTPLHLATLCNSPRAVRKLLLSGANVNAIDTRGRSPLHEFARIDSNPSLEVFETLLEAGADTDLRDHMGYSALHWAVGAGNRRLVERLWRGTLGISIDSDEEVCFLNVRANLKEFTN